MKVVSRIQSNSELLRPQVLKWINFKMLTQNLSEGFCYYGPGSGSEGACQRHCSTVSMINTQFTKVQQLQKTQTLLGVPILFAAVSDNVLTNLQQLSAPSGSTSGPCQCQNTPWYEHWELMFQTLYSGLDASIPVNYVQCLPARRCLPSL